MASFTHRIAGSQFSMQTDQVKTPQNAYRNFYTKYSKNLNIHQTSKTKNGLVQMIRMNKSTGQKRVNNFASLFNCTPVGCAQGQVINPT